jgi:hypothetical protein
MGKITLRPDIKENQSTSDSKDSAIDRQFNQKKRESIWLYRIRIFFLLIASFCTASLIIVYLWHLVVSVRWRWLTPNDMARIEGLAVTIIVGLIMSGATTYFFKRKK